MKAVQDALARTMVTTQQLLPRIALIAMMASTAAAQDATDYVPDPGSRALREGSLPGRRIGLSRSRESLRAIRMHGNYWSGPAHYFALLPYATVRYNGAHAELRDVPLGTHVHGYFFVPPKGEEETFRRCRTSTRSLPFHITMRFRSRTILAFISGRGSRGKWSRST